MANIKSSKKAIRVIKKRTDRNRARKNRVRTFVRKANDAINSGILENAKKALFLLESEIMKAAGKGVYKKKAASRKVSRTFKKMKKISSN